MDLVKLERYKLEGYLASGSDYEAYAAIDSDTEMQVVIKRPNPDYIARKLHYGVDRLSEQLIELHTAIGNTAPYVARLVGYTEVAVHNSTFGDSLEDGYRVLIYQRAAGFPLVSDIRDKFKGVTIGLGQNLFALYPLVPHSEKGYFPIHQQLMDVEEAFHVAGHLLLDMRPQNVFFDASQGTITVIDIGTVPTQGPAAQGKVTMGGETRDIHDFFAEMFKFYATPDGPPTHVAGYAQPSGMKNSPRFNEQLDSMIQSFSAVGNLGIKEAALTALQKIQNRAYSSFQEFRGDFSRYLALLEGSYRTHPDSHSLVGVWGQALGLLCDQYWKRFLFDPDSDLAPYRAT